jgi:6,7-dimethyl-8-ribityllumazine synthase
MSSAQHNLSSFDPDNLPNLPNAVIGIVVAEWHSEITNALLNGAIEALELAKVKPENIHVFKVPGTYELPYGAVKTIDKHQPDAVVCLGCVIQGETRHFDFICNAVANGLMQLNIQYKIPVTFGVLTTDNLEQAQNRSGGKHGNKGFEAGLTALKSIQ